jgi:CheY-like chemotaxis protein
MPAIFFAHDQQESPAPRRQVLEYTGFEVELFEDGTSLLAALAQRKPDLVLLDVLLPGAHGFDVCRAIRERFTAAELPVLLTSDVYRARAYRDEAEAAGAQEYLLRPIQPDELVEHASRWIEATSVRGSP